MQKLARRKIATYVADQLVAGADVSKLTDQVVAYLTEQRQTDQVELLIRDIEAALAGHGVSVVHLKSAQKLTDAQKQEATAMVQREEQTKHAVVSTEQVDPELIGGIVVRTSQSVFDGSLQGRLKQLSRLATTTE